MENLQEEKELNDLAQVKMLRRLVDAVKLNNELLENIEKNSKPRSLEELQVEDPKLFNTRLWQLAESMSFEDCVAVRAKSRGFSSIESMLDADFHRKPLPTPTAKPNESGS